MALCSGGFETASGTKHPPVPRNGSCFCAAFNQALQNGKARNSVPALANLLIGCVGLGFRLPCQTLSHDVTLRRNLTAARLALRKNAHTLPPPPNQASVSTTTLPSFNTTFGLNRKVEILERITLHEHNIGPLRPPWSVPIWSCMPSHVAVLMPTMRKNILHREHHVQ